MGEPPSDSTCMPEISHTEYLGKQLVLLSYGPNDQYLIGANVCNRFRKETFNLYRSLRVKGVDPCRGSELLLNYLLSRRTLKAGTRSVTLVPYNETLSLLNADPNLRERCAGNRSKKVKQDKQDDEGVYEEGSCGDSNSVAASEMNEPEPWVILANMVNATV